MKNLKKLFIVLTAICCIFTLAACNGNNDATTTAAEVTTTAAESTTTAAEANTSVAVVTGADGSAVTVAPGGAVIYKDIMIPFDEIVPTEHIVILENTIRYGADGFYTEETAPAATEITYKDAATQAYALTYALDFLTYGYEDGVTVYQADGTSSAMTAEDLAGCYVIVDFMSGLAPVLYNPETKTEIAAFSYLTTANAEGIYSIPADSIHNTKEITDLFGWDTSNSVRFMATDKFHIPVPTKELTSGELRGTLSGAVNGSFPELTIASGKINDVIYMELLHE